jgi:acetyl esterase/lipase
MVQKIVFFCLLFFVGICSATENSYELKENISYYDAARMKSDAYLKQMCQLDIYYPKNAQGFPVVVWFHGGGLTGGNKEIPDSLKQQGIAVVAVSYRLYPQVKVEDILQDTAAAVAWVFKNIGNLGGDPQKIVLSGHSAGAYLINMIGMDKSYLLPYGVNANQIAGLVPISGHVITHFTERKDRGIEGYQPIIDRQAPIFHVRADAPPLLLITGDRELELLGRYEENAYMMRMMKVAGHQKTRLIELGGYGHDTVAPAMPLLLNEVTRLTGDSKPNKSF